MQNLKTTLSMLAVAGTLAAVSPPAHAGPGDEAKGWAAAAVKAFLGADVKIELKVTDKGIKHITDAVILCTTSKNATILVRGCAAAGVLYAGAYCYKMINSPSPAGGKAQAPDVTVEDVALKVKYEDPNSGTKVDTDVHVYEIDSSVQKLLEPTSYCSTPRQ